MVKTPINHNHASIRLLTIRQSSYYSFTSKRKAAVVTENILI